MSKNTFSFKVHIVFDNRCVEQGFLAGFGFSALIYNSFSENYLLFDTGGNSETLIHNLKQFNVRPNDISKVIISHNHHDHAGGLEGIIRENPNVKVFVPDDDLEMYTNYFLNTAFIGVKKVMEIETNVFSSGQFGDYIQEEALFLKTKENKFVVIVGCTHPGLEQFLIKAREMAEIKAVIGGFHGFRKYSYLEGIDLIGACHCTQHTDDIKKRFPEQFKKVCVGTVLSF